MEMLTLSPEQKETYAREGYLVVQQAVSEEVRSKLLSSLLKVFLKYNPQQAFLIKETSQWDYQKFHDALLQFRKSDPGKFGLMYDSMWTTVHLQGIYFDKKIINLVEQLLNESSEGLSVASYVLRMDVPMDERNKLDWHQDSSYFQPRQRGTNGLVCWVPLVEVSEKNGSVIVCSGSHKEGKIEVPMAAGDQPGKSQQFRVPQEIATKYSQKSVCASPGDAVFFNMDIIHRSGDNLSQQIRFSALGRYHRVLTDDYTVGKFFFQESKNQALTGGGK